jgi:hypothetical protein
MNMMKSKEKTAVSNIGGGLEGMFVNHPTTDKGHHWTSPSTGFPLIFLCLHKDFLFLLMFILKKILTLFIFIVNRKYYCSINIFHHRADYFIQNLIFHYFIEKKRGVREREGGGDTFLSPKE